MSRVMHRMVNRPTMMHRSAVRTAMVVDRMVHGVMDRVMCLRRRSESGENGEQQSQTK
jgi:hypothetical protein